MTRNNKPYKKIEIPDNYQGVKLGRQKTDWIAGADSPISSNALLDTGDWKPYSSRHEIQVYNPGLSDTYDTSLCTQYAVTDVYEHLLNLHSELGNIPFISGKWFKDNGYIPQGKFELSERLGGANSDMTTKGTYLYKAANAIRHLGIVPQSKLELAESFEDNINPDLISQEIYDLGKESKEYVEMNWQWVMGDTKEALKRSPLVATVKYADGEGILKPEGRHNHAVVVVEETDDYYVIDDSYWRQYKKYHKDYVDNFMELSLTFNINNMDTNEFIQKHDTHIIRNINTGAYGVIYAGNFLKITTDRAGIFALDRLTRNYDKQEMVSITNDEWKQLDDKNLTF
jgi:hypothetical protein